MNSNSGYHSHDKKRLFLHSVLKVLCILIYYFNDVTLLLFLVYYWLQRFKVITKFVLTNTSVTEDTFGESEEASPTFMLLFFLLFLTNNCLLCKTC